MNRYLATAGGHHAAIMYDNLIMTDSPGSPLVRLLQAPFTKHTWSELGYALLSFPLAIAGFVFTVAGFANGPLLAASALGVRKFGAGSRFLAAALLGEHVPAPPRIQPLPSVRVATPDPAQLAKAAVKAGARVRVWDGGSGVTVRRLPVSRVAELAAEAGITVDTLRSSKQFAWYAGALRDRPAWRTRGYLAVKLPLAAADLVVIGACWLGGLFWLTFPAWFKLAPIGLFGGPHLTNFLSSLLLVPAGAALLIAGPWLTHRITTTDRYLIRSLLGPQSAAERVRALEESRARVDRHGRNRECQAAEQTKSTKRAKVFHSGCPLVRDVSSERAAGKPKFNQAACIPACMPFNFPSKNENPLPRSAR